MLIKAVCPTARVIRMDADTTSTKGSHDEILSAFANHQADILVGTQMIVKGHDFPDVYFSWSACSEICLCMHQIILRQKKHFSFYVRRAGRAGRGKNPGEVVIQTYAPDNYSIIAASHQDYDEFFEQEIVYRKLMGYPPVANMVSVLLQCSGESELEMATESVVQLIRKVKEQKYNELFVIGPADPPVSKINDIYRKIIYLKSDNKSTSYKIKGLFRICNK
ncbi:MAG: hypothetical protein ACLUR5_02220 [Eubacterium ventriosum]